MKTVDYLFITYMAALFAFCAWGQEIHNFFCRAFQEKHKTKAL
jgi:hypothetical protein